MDLFLTNSLTRKKERFVPQDPRRVTMYVCGPTVYNYAHIGNARPVVAFDVLFRLLGHLYGGEAVVYARNFTDIDDRIIAKSNESGEPIAALTQRFAQIYRDDAAALGALPPTIEPTATGHVGEMIALIQTLIDAGAAYATQSGVYFSVAADADYGRLSGRDLADLRAGARVESEADKRDPADFALWKAAKPGEPAWEASFGAGRPGWHIECSAMIAKQLGETIDIHGGGHDLIFPHHENEIAQSETAHGAPLARYWLHNGFLTMDAEKMSKSLGNVQLVHDLLEHWDGEVLRLALLSAHYRAPLDWTDQLLEQTKSSLDRLYGALARLDDIEAEAAAPPQPFLAALCDDLNTPKALAELFTLASAANRAESLEDQRRAKGELLAAGRLIGLLTRDPQAWLKGDDAEAAEIERLVQQRSAARAAKDWALSDRLRGELAQRGVEVMDGPQGSTWRRLR